MTGGPHVSISPYKPHFLCFGSHSDSPQAFSHVLMWASMKNMRKKVHAYTLVCPSVCVLPPNPENKHSSAEDLPTKFTKGYWERPGRTEILCTEWMWPWEVWEWHGLRNITKLLLKRPIGRKPSTFNIGAWGWPYVRLLVFDSQSQTPCSKLQLLKRLGICRVWELKEKNAILNINVSKFEIYCHFSHPEMWRMLQGVYQRLRLYSLAFNIVFPWATQWIFSSSLHTEMWLIDLQSECWSRFLTSQCDFSATVMCFCKCIPLGPLMDFFNEQVFQTFFYCTFHIRVACRNITPLGFERKRTVTTACSLYVVVFFTRTATCCLSYELRHFKLWYCCAQFSLF